MPLCIFHTNMSADRVSDEVHSKLSKIISEMTGSNETSITVELRTGKKMCRAANPDVDWGFFELHAIGVSEDPDLNRERAGKILTFAETEIGLPQTRILDPCLLLTTSHKTS
ncbi:uncharacterized protein LOC577038 isoform X2 [Strongylocentrotus purpuratus]|uniref:L-dopachrome isomerase n=1 Tax=Strongylocentrotus purpuratus TaxID=7668 RepID=A0A7M7GI79_STRPU|nr:uncharacterized protein LOC577038 isoform X2 [Strongylocentrotus purpuratus]|eukprot:XP_003728162.1 PREDICTED: uncharacterized protein LOC577038 isoform X2 [Strongylocentrotus purpuratus]